MNVLNISNHESRVFSAFDGAAIRFSILMFDKTISGGDLNDGINSDSITSGPSTQRKIVAIEAHFEKNGPTGELTLELFSGISALWKLCDSIPFRTAELASQLKSIAQIIDITYIELEVNVNHSLERSGLPILKKFVGKELRLIQVDIYAPETRGEDFEYTKMSDVLLGKFFNPMPIEAYLLTNDFTVYLAEKKIEIGNLASAKNKNAGVLKAELTLTMPNLVPFSINELEMMREQFQKVNQPFKTNLENWAAELTTLHFEEKNYTTISNYYLKKIEPELAIIQSAINSNSRMTLAKANDIEEIEYKINITVCDVSTYWDYLHHIEAITDATLQALNENEIGKERKNKACIIFEGGVYQGGKVVKAINAEA